MFCRNCGKELMGAPEACRDCGAKRMAGTSFCPQCGAPTTPLSVTCTKCGVRLAKSTRGKTWKTRTAGILAIVAGAVGLTEWGGVAVLEILELGWSTLGDVLGPVGITLVAIVMTSEIVAIVGGVFALKRRRWRLALAGSICAIFSVMAIPVLLNVPLAIAAIVLIVLGKGEFE
jgi:hypothetical protein